MMRLLINGKIEKVVDVKSLIDEGKTLDKDPVEYAFNKIIWHELPKALKNIEADADFYDEHLSLFEKVTVKPLILVVQGLIQKFKSFSACG
ncbi:MAG: hypothetical protein GY915_06080 [bacterium]|nr:hypothetical protein [bacterium]